MITPHNTLGDIGCDHGYMSITMVDRGVVSRAIAADVNEGPIKRAAENIARMGMSDRIETRLSDGLQKFEPGEVDVILIAGMGGPLMTRILRQSADVVNAADELVLQPQSNLEDFRRDLYADGYDITAEDIVFEDGKYYPMMRAVRGEASLELAEYRYGPILVREMSPVFVNYLENEKHKLENVLEKLHDSQNSERVQEVKAELALIDEVRNGKYAG